MSSLIKDKAREIISDPQKNKELRKAISRLRAAGVTTTKASIGDQTYNLRFVNQQLKKK